MKLLILFFSSFLFGSSVLAQDSGLSCKDLLGKTDSVVSTAEESFFIPIEDYAENLRRHIKRILYATYVETFPVGFLKVTEGIDKFILKANEISREKYVDGEFMRRAFRNQKAILLEQVPHLEFEYSDPVKRNLNLDYWYAKFSDELESKIASEKSVIPEDFVGSEGEWVSLLDSLFVPKAKFYPYAKKSLKRRIKSKISDMYGHIAYQQGRLFSKSLVKSPTFLGVGALTYIGSVAAVHWYANTPIGGLDVFGNVYYDWLPFHDQLHDFIKSNEPWLYFAAPATLNAYSMSYMPYFFSLPATWMQELLRKYHAKRSQKALIQSSERMAEILSQHLSSNRLSVRKISKTLRTPVQMEKVNVLKRRIERGKLSWEEFEKIYKDIGQAIKYTSSSVSAFMLYETNPLKGYATVLKEHLQHIKEEELSSNQALTPYEIRAIKSERKRALRIVQNLDAIKGYLVSLIELLEILQEQKPDYHQDLSQFELGSEELSNMIGRNRLDMGAGTHVSILALRQLLGGLETYQSALQRVNQQVEALSSQHENPIPLLERLQTLDEFFAQNQAYEMEPEEVE